MGEPEQARLRAALNRYLLARGEQGRSRDADAEVLDARRALVGLLQDAGWEPPPAVLALLTDDDRPGQQRRSA